MRGFNSTIKRKKKECRICRTPQYIFSHGRCEQCAKVEDINKEDEEEQDQIETESRKNLIDDLDAIVSLCVRHSAANKEGVISCYTCDKEITIAEAQCSHFIPRSHMATRWLLDNLQAACKECNEFKSGNLVEYENRIGKEMADFLRAEAKEIHKPTIDELKQLLSSFRFKFNLVKKKVHVKS